MKNLLIFISPTKSFNNPRDDLENDAHILIKVQIDDSLKLGWKKEDILLFTNFEYEYGGIRASLLKNVKFFKRKPQASKINAIVKLFKDGVIKEGELYWFHDLDAFQLQPITESEIDQGNADMWLTDYGRHPRWNMGTIFFKRSSEDIFNRIKEVMYRDNIDEERALGELTGSDKSIQKRVQKINKSYNFNAPNIRSYYQMAIKSLRVVHFHPFVMLGELRSFDFFKGGIN